MRQEFDLLIRMDVEAFYMAHPKAKLFFKSLLSKKIPGLVPYTGQVRRNFIIIKGKNYNTGKDFSKVYNIRE